MKPKKGKFDVARVRMDEASVTGNQVKTRGPPRHLHTRGHLLHLRPRPSALLYPG